MSGVCVSVGAGAKRGGWRCGTYMEVGDEGIEAGEREPKRCVRRCCEARFARRFSLGGLGNVVFELVWRSSGFAGAVAMGGT